MKKELKWTLVVVAFIFLPATIKVYAQAGTKKQVSIAVAGIDYDDAGFTKLKEGIKNNKKVQDVTQSFSQNTAHLSLTYTGDATALWDELPADLKKPFKITTIESNRIELQLKSTATANISAGNTSTTPSTSTNIDDCKNCYWNICKYDVLKSFGGAIYKGLNLDNGTFYYNCDNGILTQKVITVNG